MGHGGVHRQWEETYRTAENERFFEEAFDELVRLLDARTSSPLLRRAIHGLNRAWFHAVKRPGPAFGNLLVFRKQSDEPRRGAA